MEAQHPQIHVRFDQPRQVLYVKSDTLTQKEALQHLRRDFIGSDGHINPKLIQLTKCQKASMIGHTLVDMFTGSSGRDSVLK